MLFSTKRAYTVFRYAQFSSFSCICSINCCWMFSSRFRPFRNFDGTLDRDNKRNQAQSPEMSTINTYTIFLILLMIIDLDNFQVLPVSMRCQCRRRPKLLISDPRNCIIFLCNPMGKHIAQCILDRPGTICSMISVWLY